MIGNLLFLAALVLAGLSAAVQAAWLFRRDAAPDPVSHWLLAGTAILLAGTLVERSFAIGFPALTSTWESLAFYAAVVAAVCVAYRLQRAAAVPAARRLLRHGDRHGAAAGRHVSPRPRRGPAADPRAALGVAAAARELLVHRRGLLRRLVRRLDPVPRHPRPVPAGRTYDRITYTAVAIGYPIFVAGAMVFGAIWAEQAWGTWWSWDPKETWALVTCLVYTVYLHLRLVVKRRDAWPAIVSVVGLPLHGLHVLRGELPARGPARYG